MANKINSNEKDREIKAIIFDYGGVITVNLDRMVRKLVKKIFNVEDEEIKKYYHKLNSLITRGMITEDEFWQRFAKSFCKRIENKKYKGLLQEKYAKKTRNRPGIISIVKKLKKDYRVGLLSDTYKPFAEYNIKNRRYSLFNPLILSCYVKMEKPDKRMYLHIIKKLKLEPNECVFIDDHEVNARAADSVGMHGIVYTNNSSLLKEMRKLGVRI